VRKYWYNKAAIAAAVIGGCFGLNISAADAAPTPPINTVPSPTSGPHHDPAHAQRAPIDVQITRGIDNTGCVTLYIPGADISIKATHIGAGRGQIVDNVTFGLINPSGSVQSHNNGYRVNSDEYHSSLHITANSVPGNWTALVQVLKRGTDSASVTYQDRYFCVRRNTFSGNIRSSNDHPAHGQRYNLSGGVYGLNANGKNYPGMSHARVHVAFVPTHGGPVQYLGWATANQHGVWNMTTLGTGRAGHVYVIYTGNGSYAPFVSDGHLEGASVG
jgi:hypothetical protein